MYIDVHCHLTGDEYGEVGGVTAVLGRAKADGVTRIVCSGFDLSWSIQACALAEQFPQVYFTAGFVRDTISLLPKKPKPFPSGLITCIFARGFTQANLTNIRTAI